MKLWQPRWFDGVALVVGSTAPDLAYVLDGSGLPVWPFSHQVLGLVGWCLPLTLVLGWLIRRAAPALAVPTRSAGPVSRPARACRPPARAPSSRTVARPARARQPIPVGVASRSAAHGSRAPAPRPDSTAVPAAPG
ncbi:DUF4184 family protein [Actinoplanes sp. NPDC089786]|uniref:DUF4184 family protein n=1 Tax=Actinoplanes sp. NPDC089786 TaxID=3155185 RepID=UPI0034364D8D